MTIVRKAIPEIERIKFNAALHEACRILNEDMEAHIKAHGSWHIDAGKLYGVLERCRLIDRYSRKDLQEAYLKENPE